jgi:hypothetical protein
MTLQLELPFAVPEHARIDPWNLSNLLYDLAITLGLVSLNKEEIIIFGEWGGKGSSDYLNENVKARFVDDKMFDIVSRQLAICRKILEKTTG